MKKKLIIVLTLCFTAFFTNLKAQLLTVHRYFKAATGKHFYTTDFSELGNGGLGYVHEMPLGRVSATGTSAIAIYRFYNTATSAHYYSMNSTPPSGFHFESILGYSVGPPFAVLLPVYQFHDDHGDFFYSTSSATPSGYHPDGVVFQVTN